MENKYLTVHSVAAMERKEYSIWRANIDNTPEKLAKVKEIFPAPNWWIEQHPIKHDMRTVIK